jgi:TnpA family transposase
LRARHVSIASRYSYRASGLNLLVAAIILWNTVYLQRAVDHLRKQGIEPGPNDLAHLSPLG